MNFKKLLKTCVAGLSLFVMVGSASAAITSDINVYGASAQFIMWRDNAAAYMTSQGCTGAQSAQLGSGTPWRADGRNAITRATCGGVTRYFRTTAKASYDGILAIQGNTTHPNRVIDSGCTAFERKMINPATCDWGTGQCTGSTACAPVTVGASDVPVECFEQVSNGNLQGPLGGAWTARNFVNNPITWSGAAPCKPLIVPFAFFVNNSVHKTGATISNITKDNAELIFNGQVYDWSDIVDVDGTSFDALPIQVCLRHAGSGTHASIDGYLTNALINTQDNSGPYNFYHNDGSSDELRCVNGSGSWTGTGAIGYADADQTLGTTYASTTRIALNGVTPSANTIQNGTYNFYGLQQIYGVTASDPLCTFASNPANITNPLWVAACKMEFMRSGACDAFPLQWVGASCP